MTVTEREFCNNRLAEGQSALSDFASLIDDQVDEDVDDGDRDSELGRGGPFFGSLDRRSGSSSPKSKASDVSSVATSAGGSSSNGSKKGSSFFDELKAKVDGTSNLSCDVCGHESKCLSEFMCHQRTHVTKCGPTASNFADKHLSAADLKSTRCRHCRKRCKTSAELIVHLNTVCSQAAATAAAQCRGASKPKEEEEEMEVVVIAVNPDMITESDHHDEHREDDDVEETQENEASQHPMENKIFVWNPTAVYAPEKRDDDATTVVSASEVEVTTVEPEPESPTLEQSSASVAPDQMYSTYVVQPYQQSPRKEGKMYKTVSFYWKKICVGSKILPKYI